MPRHQPGPLRICHFNAQSMSSKLEEIKHFLATNSIHICSINETWLKPGKTLNFPFYKIFRKDRSTQGGGVCLLVHESIVCEQINFPFILTEEILAVRLHAITKDKQDIVVATYYNPPQCTFNPAPLNHLFSQHHKTLVVGDLNSHHTGWGSSHTCKNGERIVDLILDSDLTLLNNDQPTYSPMHRIDYSATLDLALCSPDLASSVLSFEVHDELRSDHLPFIVELQSSMPSLTTLNTKTITTINLPKFIEQASQEEASIQQTDQLNTIEEIEAAAASLTTAIQRAQTAASKTNTIAIHNNKLNILPPHVVAKIKARKKAERRYKKTHLPADNTTANRLKEQVSCAIKKHNRHSWQHHCTELNTHHVSDTILWRKLESISNGKPPRSTTICLDIDGSKTTEPQTVANAFSAYLGSVFSDSNSPDFDSKFHAQVTSEKGSFFSYEATPPQLTTSTEVQAIITKIRGKGAPGPDAITNKLLKNLPPIYCHHMANIFNACLAQSHMPTKWKEAAVVMLPKAGTDPTSTSSYRPISLLNTLSKILERVVLARLLAWLNEHNILSKYQSGFRAGKQTRDHLFRLIQDVLAAFNCGYMVGAVFVDIEKAFDKVWHDGLLYKLNSLKAPTYLCMFIANYLKDRSLRVRYKNVHSNPANMLAGVPQGSVLGPILFNIFFNDVSDIKGPAELAMFADDLASWTSSHSAKSIERKLQDRLTALEDWASQWRTIVSITKTRYIVFDKKRRKTKLHLTYNNRKLEADENPVFLGLTLDPQLRFHKHANAISSRVGRRLNMLKRIRGPGWGASSKLIIQTYKTLIRPIIDYVPFATIVMSKPLQLKLERLQRAAIRVATHWPTHTSAETMNKKVGLTPVLDRAHKLGVSYLSKAIATNGIAKETIKRYLKKRIKYDGASWKANNRPTLLGQMKKWALAAHTPTNK